MHGASSVHTSMADAVQVPAGGVTSGTQSTNLHQHVCTSADGGADIDYFKLTSPTAAGLVFAEVEKSAVFDYEDASCTKVSTSYYLLNIVITSYFSLYSVCAQCEIFAILTSDVSS